MKLCLFDIDGTLVLTGGAGGKALARACLDVAGIDDALGGISLGGKTDPIIVEEIFRARSGRSASQAEYDAIVARYLVYLVEEVARTQRYQVLPGVAAALDLFHGRGATIGLATGNVEPAARIKLERGALWHRFGFGGYGSDAGDRGELVAHAIARGEAHAGRRFAKQDVLVIGDTPRDVAAAHACGVPCLAVATGGDDVDTLRRAGADAVIDTLDALPAWIESQ